MGNTFTNYTVKMQGIMEGIEDDFSSFYTKEDAEREIRTIARGQSSARRAKANLTEMLRGSGITPEWDSSGKLKNPEKVIGAFLDEEELEAKMYRKMHDVYLRFPTSENYLKRIVNRLGDPDFRNDSVRLAIVRQFLRYTDYCTKPVLDYIAEHLDEEARARYKKLKGAEKKEFGVAHVDESVFNALTEYTKTGDRRKDRDTVKNLQKKYRLLILANDLAQGKFHTNGGTRADLYRFAIAFGMTVYTDDEADAYDGRLDLEKNLFYEYYQDNFLRYISDHYKDNASSVESEPTGEGINYKNFAEIIYLYYLQKKDLSIAEKLKRAEKMISDCARAASEPEHAEWMESDLDAPDGFSFTGSYKEMYFTELCNIPEGELLPYICENYYIPPETIKGSKLSAASEENTARTEYENLLEELRLYMTGAPEASDIGSGFDFESRELASSDDPNYIRLLKMFDAKLHIKRKGNTTIFDPGPDARVTRTDMIALYYYLFIYLNENGSGHEHIPLPQIVDEFRSNVNYYLEASRFQKFTTKNIYDIFVVFALYRQLNLI